MKAAFATAILALGLVPGAALADPPVLHVDPSLDDCSVRFAPELTQGAFHQFVRQFGSISAFKPMAAPEPLGRGRVELSVQQISFGVDEGSPTWNDTFAHPMPDHYLGSHLSFPKATVRVGLTDRTDLGAYYTRNPEANYGWIGLEARQAVLCEREGRPVDLGARLAWTRTLYVEDMALDAVTADVSVGRTVRRYLKPYAGAGFDLVHARERSAVVDLHDETVMVPRAFAGLGVHWRHVALGVEGELGALNRFEFQVAAVR
jgi:hypothetical protein